MLLHEVIQNPESQTKIQLTFTKLYPIKFLQLTFIFSFHLLDSVSLLIYECSLCGQIMTDGYTPSQMKCMCSGNKRSIH